jgi:hypothetical protein
VLNKTEDRIRRSRAERSHQKQCPHHDESSCLQDVTISKYLTNSDLREVSTPREELANLRKEVKYLSEQLKEERNQHHYRSSDDEIRSLKLEIASFQDKFRHEIYLMQESYKDYIRDFKVKKSHQITELQHKLNLEERRNFELEAQVKEMKIKL